MALQKAPRVGHPAEVTARQSLETEGAALHGDVLGPTAASLMSLGRVYYSGGSWRIEFNVEPFVATLGLTDEEAMPLIAEAMKQSRPTDADTMQPGRETPPKPVDEATVLTDSDRLRIAQDKYDEINEPTLRPAQIARRIEQETAAGADAARLVVWDNQAKNVDAPGYPSKIPQGFDGGLSTHGETLQVGRQTAPGVDAEITRLAREVVLSSHYDSASCGNEAVHRLRAALRIGRCGHHTADYGIGTSDA